MKPTISVCTIVKNEQNQIQDFLESLNGFADEIIVVDTGSTDSTPELVEGFILSHNTECIRLLRHDIVQGGFHYGIAKNFSIDNATGDYAIILDVDERLSDNFKEAIRSFLSKEKPLVTSVVRKDELLPHLVDYPERIIKLDSGIRYGLGEKYRVHEQLAHDISAKQFPGVIWHQQRWNHYVIRPQRILFQLELQIDRTPRTRSFLGHIAHGAWYFFHRFKKIYFKRKLYKDGILGFKYAFIRALDAFLIDLFVGLRPKRDIKYWEGDILKK